MCDRVNDRMQVFRKNGTFVKEFVIAPATRGNGSTWDADLSADPAQAFLYNADGENNRGTVDPRTAAAACWWSGHPSATWVT